MKQFSTQLKRYLTQILTMKKYSMAVEGLINYLTSDNITTLGFYATLENNDIQNITSIKNELLNFYCDLKRLIQTEDNYISYSNLEEIHQIKSLFQINEIDLNKYKSSEIKIIVDEQSNFLKKRTDLKKSECKKNLYLLKELLGLQNSELTTNISII